MKLKISALAFALTVGSGGVMADPATGHYASGWMGNVLSCFFDCKPGPTVSGIGTWSEMTTLTLINQHPTDARTALMVIRNANSNIIAGANLSLNPMDLDEVNICRTLKAALPSITPPQTGVVELAIDQNPGAVYGWIKDYVGKFSVARDDPFEGVVNGAGKTICMHVPPEVSTTATVYSNFSGSGAPTISPVLINGSNP
jgi:hypothetical protein